MKEELLRTIRIPKNLHYLTDNLPKSNYGNDSDLYSHHTIGNTPNKLTNEKRKPVHSSNKGILPKLSQIIKGNPRSPSIMERKHKRNIGNSLMIEGKSKMIEEARSYEKNDRHLEKEIKEELKRIYKVKGVKSDDRLPRREQRGNILPPIRL